MRSLSAFALSFLLASCALQPMQTPSEPPVTTDALSWNDVLQRPQPGGGTVINYGTDALQFGVLRVPATPGPHPVIALIHGGCWLNQFDWEYFEHWSAWLSSLGYATWNIEYRRLGDAGGGWPGTFQDTAAALDYLRQLAPKYDLDLRSLRVAGHSAGGHLALWAAARKQLPLDSELASTASISEPVSIQQVIGLAAITNLESYRIGPAQSCHASVDVLLGGTPQTHTERFRQASPHHLLPLDTEIVLIQGDADSIVSPESCTEFAATAKAAGDTVHCILLPGAGHFDTGVPTPASTFAMREALRR